MSRSKQSGRVPAPKTSFLWIILSTNLPRFFSSIENDKSFLIGRNWEHRLRPPATNKKGKSTLGNCEKELPTQLVLWSPKLFHGREKTVRRLRLQKGGGSSCRSWQRLQNGARCPWTTRLSLGHLISPPPKHTLPPHPPQTGPACSPTTLASPPRPTFLGHLYACMLGFRLHSGDHRAHSMRSGKHCLFVFVCLFY